MRTKMMALLTVALVASFEARAAEQAVGITFLDGPGAVRELCLALRPTNRVLTKSVEGRASHEEVRRNALAGLYRLDVPAEGYAFGAYESREEKLPIDVRKPFRAFHGAVSLAVLQNTRAFVDLTQEGARSAQASWKARAGTLEVIFSLDDRPDGACSGQVATDVYTLAGKVVAVTLRDGMGVEVGSGETSLADHFRGILGGYSGVPSVRIGGILGEEDVDAAHVAGRLATIVEAARRCYETRLRERPGVMGTLVLGVVVGDEGHVEAIDVVADALGDEQLRTCAKNVISKLTFEIGKALFRVPVEFTLVTRQ